MRRCFRPHTDHRLVFSSTTDRMMQPKRHHHNVEATKKRYACTSCYHRPCRIWWTQTKEDLRLVVELHNKQIVLHVAATREARVREDELKAKLTRLKDRLILSQVCTPSACSIWIHSMDDVVFCTGGSSRTATDTEGMHCLFLSEWSVYHLPRTTNNERLKTQGC